LDERVVAGAVVHGQQPESGRIGTRLVSESGRDRALVTDERDELRHRRAKALAQVGFLDALARGQNLLAVRQLLASVTAR
jgi:hypothetical protein